jgi:hypothetical protein
MSTPKCVCGRFAVYGYPWERATKCGLCKNIEMIQLYSECVCGNKAIYGRFKKATCCIYCRAPDMTYKRNRCICGKIAIYKYPGTSATHCNSCKKEHMVSTLKKCLCNTRVPNFGYLDGPIICCNLCKKNGMYSRYHIMRKYISNINFDKLIDNK